MKKLFLFFCFLGLSVALADEQKPFVYQDKAKRDPFWPLVSGSGTLIAYDADIAASEMMLEGIMMDAKGNNLAIINGKVIKVGDQVGAYSVKAILNDHVILSGAQEQLRVNLKKGGV